MKYSILGFRQDVCLACGLDAIDLLILAWMKDFIASPRIKMLIINDKPYYWIYQKLLIDDLPVLRISSRQGFLKRINRFIDLELLERKIIHSFENRRGTYVFYAFTDKFDALSRQPQLSGGDNHSCRGVTTTVVTKDLPTRDLPTKERTRTRANLRQRQQNFLDSLFQNPKKEALQ